MRFIFSVSGELCGLSAILRHFLPPSAENIRQENRLLLLCRLGTEWHGHLIDLSGAAVPTQSSALGSLLGRRGASQCISGLVSSHTLIKELIVDLIEKIYISSKFLVVEFFFLLLK